MLDKNADISTLTKATEIIVVILARHLRRSPFDMSFLLVEKMQLLTKLVIVGRRGDYSSVVHIMEDLYRHCDKIIPLALTDSTRDTLHLFLEIVRMGFVSKDENVTKWTVNATSKIVYCFTQNNFSGEIYDCLVKKCNYVPVAVNDSRCCCLP